jgi:hypothetical protein
MSNTSVDTSLAIMLYRLSHSRPPVLIHRLDALTCFNDSVYLFDVASNFASQFLTALPNYYVVFVLYIVVWWTAIAVSCLTCASNCRIELLKSVRTDSIGIYRATRYRVYRDL